MRAHDYNLDLDVVADSEDASYEYVFYNNRDENAHIRHAGSVTTMDCLRVFGLLDDDETVSDLKVSGPGVVDAGVVIDSFMTKTLRRSIKKSRSHYNMRLKQLMRCHGYVL